MANAPQKTNRISRVGCAERFLRSASVASILKILIQLA